MNSFRFISYNLWYGKNWEKEIEFIKKHNPDIFVLQEVTKNIPKFGLDNTDVFLKLKRAFPNYQSFYGPINYKKEAGKEVSFGNVIFSRFSLISSKIHHLLNPPGWANAYEDQSKNLLEAKIEIDGKEIYIFTTHLTFSPAFVDTPNKLREIKELAKIIKGKKPFILAGDFNSHPGTKAIRTISEIANYLDQKNRPTWTKHPFSYKEFSETKLKWKIDYIFASEELKCVNYSIVDIDLSDHLPIIVDFEL